MLGRSIPGDLIVSQTAVPIELQYIDYERKEYSLMTKKEGRTIRDIDIELVNCDGVNIDLNGKHMIVEIDIISYDD